MKIANLVVGGGIAGLWTAVKAHRSGLEVAVVTPELGGGQSLLSQGIIHGGTKYALSGKLTGASEAIKAMPQRWLDALDGNGDVDLSAAKLTSAHQYMIHDRSLSGSVAQFLASKSLRGRVDKVAPPEFLDSDRRVFQLSEPVIDTASVLNALAAQVPMIHGRYEPSGCIDGQPIEADRIIFAAGEGNEPLMPAGVTMQRRPLQMLVGQGPLPALWAHLIGGSTKPLATITTHQGFWYVGGQIAEDGAEQTEQEFLVSAPERLQKLLPEIDFSAVTWSSVRVNRAEPAQAMGNRPDSAYVDFTGEVATVWPTKLALAPAAADVLIPWMSSEKYGQLSTEWTIPPLAQTPWSNYE